MKLTLIKPPIGSEALYGKVKNFGNFQQPLGLAYIASYVRAEGFDASIIDAQILNLKIDEVLERIRNEESDVIGLTSNTIDFSTICELAEIIKKELDLPILIGGPRISALPKDVMKHKCFDVGVIGEGEIPTLNLLKNFNGNFSNLDKIDGIVYMKKNNILVKKAILVLIDNILTQLRLPYIYYYLFRYR